MTWDVASRRRIRKFFGRISEIQEMPNLVEIQKRSYDQFLLRDEPPQTRSVRGLQAVFKSIFPIRFFTGQATLEFLSYDFDEPQYDVEECRQRRMTYAAPLKVTLRLVIYETDEETGISSVREVKDQDVYMGDVPLMTKDGTFIINGTERVVVSQMQRSPGVLFDHDKGKTHASGKILFAGRIIPYRGSWVDFEFDSKDILYVRIDRRRKLPATVLLRALLSSSTESLIQERLRERFQGKEQETLLEMYEEGRCVEILNQVTDLLAFDEVQGMSPQDILAAFYESVTYNRKPNGWTMLFKLQQVVGKRYPYAVFDAKTGKEVIPPGKKMSALMARKIGSLGVRMLLVPDEALLGQCVAEDLVDKKTGEVLAPVGTEITEELMTRLRDSTITRVPVLHMDRSTVGGYIRDTMMVDKCHSRQDALFEIYRVMRPGEPPTLEAAEKLFRNLFFEKALYDLSAVGRVKLNMRLGMECPDHVRCLRKEDILGVVRVLVALREGRDVVDDIDSLGNRRVRSVGELVENQFRIGLTRMERSIREWMSAVDIDKAMPQDLINVKPLVTTVKEFFSSSQLSQFMDQTNPLAEVTHKRRLSALGPGGLTRERAGFEVRDVHPTHYGRICPVETPEGPNIGLINSLATHARINKYGFIETPYRKVTKRKVSKDLVYLSAVEESRRCIAQASTPLDAQDKITDQLVVCRKDGEVMQVPVEEVDLMDASPKQIVSVAAALIPFLENDDANRALMGSNMQRQAVPLVRAESPLVGTGVEETVARDSGAAMTARRDGIVDQVDAKRIFIRAAGKADASRSVVDIYDLYKFQRSNQSTCINQRPLVQVGDKVKAGDIIADGPATDQGELALGRNVLVAFMPWNGYNFEDSILISERLVRDDVFTSIHIEEFEAVARDTKLGPEYITRDIPNVGEDMLSKLDEAGIVHIGAEVNAGDILVGKVTPKSESLMTPEEKLLRAIFGEKAADVRDTSLRLPPGVSGTVVEVQVFNRHGVEKDERAQAIEREMIEKMARDRDDELSVLKRNIYGRLMGRLQGEKAAKAGETFSKGEKLTSDLLQALPRQDLWNIVVSNAEVMEDIESLRHQFDEAEKSLEARFTSKVSKLQAGVNLKPGEMKVIRVFVAVKRKLQPGDKMAGRHGNKGVISHIAPIEDMPYLEDGTPVDVVLNPLGVPSRMNVGQILETHLGWACAGMGAKIAELAREARHKGRMQPLRAAFGDIYGKSDPLLQHTDEVLLEEITPALSQGVPMATPVFSGAQEQDIVEAMERVGLESSGQVTLYDGRTGSPFHREVTVGYLYMLKLHHLVDDKIHARSTGPYSLVTQQPLGGKAQFGGQRFGEMEVWALEAYGAAYTLQEMLTVKSDDVAGRTKAYEAIVRGEENFEAGLPESFNVLVKEIRALGLNIEQVHGSPSPQIPHHPSSSGEGS